MAGAKEGCQQADVILIVQLSTLHLHRCQLTQVVVPRAGAAGVHLGHGQRCEGGLLAAKLLRVALRGEHFDRRLAN